MRGRWIVALGVVLAGVLSPQAASAKMPAFEIEVLESPSPSRGDLSIRVVVDEEFRDFDAPDLDGLLAVYPAEVLTEDLRPASVLHPLEGGIAVPLAQSEDGSYVGSVVLPDHGHPWVIVPFPRSHIATADLVDKGYPAPVLVDSGATSFAVEALLGAAAVVAGVFALAWRARRARRVLLAT